MRLKDKIALITGGSRGIGAACAILFATQGAKVVICDVLEKEAEKVISKIEQLGGDAFYVELDVSNENQWESAIDTIIKRYGTINVLVNNAGIAALGNVENTTTDSWDTIMRVNATGVFLGTRYVLPIMRDSGKGSIINMSSTAGIVGSTLYTAYHASKGAVRLLTKATAVQYAKENIRVNSVHPGPITSEMSNQLLGEKDNRAKRLSQVPLGRFGNPEEVAYGVLYLASDEASFVTGSELVIDGGFTAQ